jgi:hypothetical protein
MARKLLRFRMEEQGRTTFEGTNLLANLLQSMKTAEDGRTDGELSLSGAWPWSKNLRNDLEYVRLVIENGDRDS